jgi:hypothetical protein
VHVHCIVFVAMQKCDYSHGKGASDLEFIKAIACLLTALQPDRPFARKPSADLPAMDASILERAARLIADQRSTALQRIATSAAFVALACNGGKVRAQST